MSLLHTNKYDVIIIGAGAAGLMATATASKFGKKSLLIEHTKKIGEKIRISGGGRCNFTNMKVTSDNFICPNRHFVKSALSQYSQDDFIQMVERHKIDYHEKTLGQLFCDKSSKQIINMLLEECNPQYAEIKTECQITDVQKSQNFIVSTNLGQFESKSLIVATGGLSIPQIGASSFGYDLAKKFNLTINHTKPALVPLKISDVDLAKYSDLRGTSSDAIVSYDKISFRENILFTHKGFSGPAILQISSYLKNVEKDIININLLPENNLYEYFNNNPNLKFTPAQYLRQYLTNRLVKYLTGENPDLEIEITNLNKYKLNKIAEQIHNFKIHSIGCEGYAKAEVTGGGIDTNQINSKTMECKTVPNLYFVGEVLDVTGWLGGYNFQWAWSSGYVAGLNA